MSSVSIVVMRSGWWVSTPSSVTTSFSCRPFPGPLASSSRMVSRTFSSLLLFIVTGFSSSVVILSLQAAAPGGDAGSCPRERKLRRSMGARPSGVAGRPRSGASPSTAWVPLFEPTAHRRIRRHQPQRLVDECLLGGLGQRERAVSLVGVDPLCGSARPGYAFLVLGLRSLAHAPEVPDQALPAPGGGRRTRRRSGCCP